MQLLVFAVDKKKKAAEKLYDIFVKTASRNDRVIQPNRNGQVGKYKKKILKKV